MLCSRGSRASPINHASTTKAPASSSAEPGVRLATRICHMVVHLNIRTHVTFARRILRQLPQDSLCKKNCCILVPCLWFLCLPSFIAMASGTVIAEIHYLQRLPLYKREKPFQLFVPVDKNGSDPRTTNLEFESRHQRIQDIRHNIASYSLDSHSFEARNSPTTLLPSEFSDARLVESRYFAEVENLLKTIEGGYDKILIYDWRVCYDSFFLNTT